MVEHGGSSAGSYLADPTSSIPSHCASIIMTSTVRVNFHGIYYNRTECHDLLFQKLLTFNQQDRISAQDALKHPYFVTPEERDRHAQEHSGADLSDIGNTSMSSSVDNSSSGSNLEDEQLVEDEQNGGAVDPNAVQGASGGYQC